MVVTMKINRAIKIFLMVLLVNIMFAAASVDSIHKCEDRNCMEGTKIEFNVTILNNINKTIIVKDVYIKDVDYGTVLAYDTSEDIVLNQDGTHDFRFESTVKSPRQGYTFYYVPCFIVSHTENPDEESEVCGKIVKSLTVIPLDKIECADDGECADDEYCNTFSLYKCIKLDCNEGQTIVNHNCVDILPQQITVINWWNVFILLLGTIVLIMLLLLFFGKKGEDGEGDDFDIDLTNEETDKDKNDTEKINKEKEKQSSQSQKEKQEESKKTEKKNKAEKEFKEKQDDNPEQDKKTDENPEKMKKKKARKKYKKVNKEIKPIIDDTYGPEDEKSDNIKKQNPGEAPYDEETSQDVVDYGSDDYDEDDEENRNPFM